jgi:hypothetical protein
VLDDDIGDIDANAEWHAGGHAMLDTDRAAAPLFSGSQRSTTRCIGRSRADEDNQIRRCGSRPRTGQQTVARDIGCENGREPAQQGAVRGEGRS